MDNKKMYKTKIFKQLLTKNKFSELNKNKQTKMHTTYFKNRNLHLVSKNELL